MKTTLFLPVCLAVRAGFLALALVSGINLHAAVTLHYWHGGAPNNSYWDNYMNWLGGVPGGLSDRVILDTGAARKLNTNNLAAATYFESISILDSGYNVYGNSVRMNRLAANYPGGTSSTFRPDIIAWGDLFIEAEVRNSTLNVVGDLILANNNLIFPESSLGNVTVLGIIGGTGGVTKNPGVGEVTFGGVGANTYTGTTMMLGGTLRLSRYSLFGMVGTVAVPGDLSIDYSGTVLLERNNQIVDSSTITFTGGTLDLDGNSDTVGSIAGWGNIDLRTDGRLIVGANDRSTTFSGTMVGSGGFDKIGNGTLFLTGYQTYTGPTRVLDGALRVDGSWFNTSSITVSNGATLGGEGVLSDITIAAGGTLHPGVGGAVAILGAAGSVTFAASATYRVQLVSVSVHDAFAVNPAGVVNLGSCSLKIIPGPGIRVGDSFTIVEKLGSNPIVGTFQGLAEGERFVVSNRLFQITYRGGTGNDVVLTRVEPPAVSLSLARSTDTQMQIGGRGVPGLIYVLEGASNLKPPITWKPLGTNVAGSNGSFSFLDDYSGRVVARFYRAWSP